MKRSKKILAACSLTIGIGAGAIIFTPAGINAANNVVLASVDWVNSVINPINTKVSTLESKVAALEAKVTAQQQEINSLKGQVGSTSPGTPSTPETPTTPEKPGLPSVVYVNKSSANIRSGASSSYKVVATKAQGSSLNVIDSFTGAQGLWYRVSVTSSLKGWVFSGDISTTKPTVTTPTKVVTIGEVNLRKGASTGYAIVELIPKGITLKYIQTFTNSKGEVWVNVEAASGNKGWITASLGEVK